MIEKTEIKLSWLKLSIIIFGYFVIFGLGFAIGLNYAQNIYVIKNTISQTSDIEKKIKENSINENLAFYNELKNKKVDSFLSKERTKQSLPINRKSENELFKTPDITENEKNLAFTIQVYSFKSSAVSEKVIADLRRKGFPAFQSKIELGNGEEFFRIRIGHFTNRTDATGLLEKIIKTENKNAFITRE